MSILFQVLKLYAWELLYKVKIYGATVQEKVKPIPIIEAFHRIFISVFLIEKIFSLNNNSQA
jgi:hypothetical protein